MLSVGFENVPKKFAKGRFVSRVRAAVCPVASKIEFRPDFRWKAAVHGVARRLEYFRSDLAAVDACVMAAARQPDAFHLHRSYWRINRQITVESSVEYPGPASG